MNICTTPERKMNTDALVQMMVVAQASLDLWHAEEASNDAREEYRHDIWSYEKQHGHLTKRLSSDAPEHAAIRAYTADTYKIYQALKRRVYAAKCRLKKACRELAYISEYADNGFHECRTSTNITDKEPELH